MKELSKIEIISIYGSGINRFEDSTIIGFELKQYEKKTFNFGHSFMTLCTDGDIMMMDCEGLVTPTGAGHTDIWDGVCSKSATLGCSVPHCKGWVIPFLD